MNPVVPDAGYTEVFKLSKSNNLSFQNLESVDDLENNIMPFKLSTYAILIFFPAGGN